MGLILDFFLGGPARVKGLLIFAGIAAVAASGLAGWGLYWRGEYREARAEVVSLQAQATVLGEAVRSCSAGVEAAKAAAAGALAQGDALLAEARRLHSGGRAVARDLDKAVRDALAASAAGKPPAREDGSPKDCVDAWREIIETEQKAGRER